MELTPTDQAFLEQTFELARRGEGFTHPNPMVGAVVVNTQGDVVGQGYHTAYGQAHAEVEALRQAGEQATGSTLYVSLEPCNHQGKTPPCTQAITEARIARVYYAVGDPNPNVAGGGAETLSRVGLNVIGPCMAEAGARLNEAFFWSTQTQRPFIVVKSAMTADGRIATRSGHSQWITSDGVRQEVHQLRSVSCAVLSTAQTVLADNAALTVRDVPLKRCPPRRVILDRQGRLAFKDELALFQPTEHGGPVTVVLSPRFLTPEKTDWFEAHGCQVMTTDDDGLHLDLYPVLSTLFEERVTQVMVEAGGQLVGYLFAQGLVNRWVTYTGPMVLGDDASMAGVSGLIIPTLSQATPLSCRSVAMVDGCVRSDWSVKALNTL